MLREFVRLRELLSSGELTSELPEVETDYNFRYSGMADIGNILIIETSSVGEVVLTTPALKALRRAYPESSLNMLVIPETKDILIRNHNVDNIICYDKKRTHRNWWKFLRFAAFLRKKKFDMVLLFHRSFRSALLAFLSGARIRVGCSAQGRSFLLTRKVPDRNNIYQHEVERNIDVVENLGIDVYNRELEMPLSGQAENYITEFWKTAGIGPEEMVIGINPGAGWPTKRWMKEKFARLSDALINKYGCRIILLWGPGERKLVQEIAGLMNREPIIACRTDLQQLGALLKRCTAFITNDSGPMHIAMAVKTPTVAIMGPTSPERWGPYGRNFEVVQKDLPCVPCFRKHCESMACMKLISCCEIMQALARLNLKKAPRYPDPEEHGPGVEIGYQELLE